MAKTRTLHRSINKRWVVTGTLVLQSPAHFGNGDADPLTDMPLLLDEASGQPLLPGTSIAGALRSFLRERAFGFGQKESGPSLANKLFGSARESEEGEQSPLIVHDSVCNNYGAELRDGVAIDADTRTAADEKKFDLQLLAAGSEFPLRFELLVNRHGDELLKGLATALDGLEKGEITLGARKRRGFGQVTVRDWRVYKYDLSDRKGLLDWLASERNWRPAIPPQEGASLAEMLETSLDVEDRRNMAHLKAVFAIDGTLMIRSGFGQADSGPDMVHLHAPRVGSHAMPVIPGTSWAGILRHRALKIARTVSKDAPAVDADGKIVTRKVAGKPAVVKQADVFVEEMFGPTVIERGNKNVKASRVNICESEIQKAGALVITRVKIDRFTGGAFESALFSEQPVVGTPDTYVTLDLSLREPRREELGLLLLLLKDLWIGDLPVGGESGVGRGYLKGVHAMLTTAQDSWEFSQDGNKVKVTPGSEKLEGFVEAFNRELKKAQVEK